MDRSRGSRHIERLPSARPQCQSLAMQSKPAGGEDFMTGKSALSAVEPLLPVELGSGGVKFAQGMKAGRWVFATGLMAQDFVNGIAPDVLAERMPHAGLPKREKE